MRWKKIRKRVKYAALYKFIKLLFWLTDSFPRKWTLAFYHQLGLLAFYLMKPVRKLIANHLQYAYGKEINTQEIKAFSRKVFVNMAKNAADIFIARSFRTKKDIEKIVDYQGLQYLESAIQKNKGVIALTCHLGAFELIGQFLSFRYPTSAVGKRMHNPKMNKLLMDFRSDYGARVIYSDEGLLKPLRVLQKGEVFIILIDQDIPKGKGTFVDFYGKPAYTPIGAAWLALKSDAAVVPMAVHRLPNERHLVTILPEVEVSRSGSNEQDIQENTQRFTNALEELIRQEPSQWVWMHKRWKTQPNDKKEPIAS